MGEDRESPSILGNPNRRVRQEERHIVSAGQAQQSQCAGGAWEKSSFQPKGSRSQSPYTNSDIISAKRPSPIPYVGFRRGLTKLPGICHP